MPCYWLDWVYSASQRAADNKPLNPVYPVFTANPARVAGFVFSVDKIATAAHASGDESIVQSNPATPYAAVLLEIHADGKSNPAASRPCY